MSHKILVIDDEISICEILEFNLKSEGYIVEIAHSAEEALEKISQDIDLLLLDIMMGGISGYKLAEKLRSEGNQLPIIFLTAKDTENDMLTGFSVGGDDYIQKPFSIKEVSARVKALLKRTQNKNTEQVKPKSTTKIQLEELIIDTELKTAIVNNEVVNLTKTEFEILILLVNNTERVLSRQEIIDTVWGDGVFVTERTVDVHITRLRKKLGAVGSAITNRSGFGYRFDSSNA